MTVLGRNGMIGRGWRYYRRHGWERSMKMLRRKLTGTAPIETTKYVAGFNEVAASPPAPVQQQEPAWQPAGGFVRRTNDFANTHNPFTRNVAIIGDTNLPQCKKYRILQKLEALEGLGLRADYSFWGDVPRSLNLLQTASCIILYRMQENNEFNAYLAEARRLDIPVGYDIDDPIFDRKVYGKNVNLSFLKESEKESLLGAADSYRRAMARSDFVIVSTPGMKELAAKSARHVHVWRNSVDAEAVHWSKVALKETVERNPDEVVIGYSSGSRAHEADFRIVEKPLLDILEKYPHTRLKIIGHLDLPASFEPFAERIEERPLASYGDYLRLLRTVDLNLVPLVQDGFNHCKSAIRYLDSATVGVPTIAAKVGDFVNVMDDGKTGLLAASEDDWINHLSLLIEDGKARQGMGARAMEKVMSESAVAAEAARLEPKLSRALMEGVL